MSTPPHLVAVAGRTYTVVESTVLRTAALVVARVAGTGSRARVTSVRSLTPHTSAHVASGGWVVVCGDPAVTCPDLATTAHRFLVEISTVAGRVVLELEVPIGSILPVVAPDLEVAATPIALAGTVTTRAFPHAPIPNARVSVSGSHPLGFLLGLRTELASAHPVGAAVRVRNASPGVAVAVAETAPSGAIHLVLTSTAGLAPGDLLAWANGEFGIVDRIDPAGDGVTLRLPTRRTLNVGDPVNRVTLGAVGAMTTLARAAAVGDGVVVTAAPVTGTTVEVDDPDPARREVRATGSLTDAEGRYRIAGVRGLDVVQLRFSAGGFTPLGPRSYPLNPDVDPTVIDAALAV